MDNLLLVMIIAGLGLSGAYLRAELSLQLRFKTAERRRELALRALHTKKARLEEAATPGRHPSWGELLAIRGIATEAKMRFFVACLLIVALTGCTTFRPLDASAEDLSRQIASGELLKRGDHVLIVTKDRQTHEIDVASISKTTIDGKRESIPIDQVVSFQKRELNTKKTLLLVGLVVAGVTLVAAIAKGLQGVAAAGILGSTH